MTKTVRIIVIVLISLFAAAAITVGALGIFVWSKQYDVDFELDGGIILDQEEIKYKIGKEYTLPEPVKPGYVFDGWYKNELFIGESVDTVIIKDREDKEDLKLYAKYVKASKIEYKLNGGTADNPAIIRIDECVMLLDAEKPGAVFEGWYLDEELTESIVEIRNPEQDITLYAKFVNVYKVKYYLNGGTASNVETVREDEIVALNDATRPGTAFDGWYLDSDFSHRIVALENVTSDITLYAKFVDLVSVTYNLYGGSTNNPTNVRKDSTLYLTDAQSNGLVFDGWYLDSGYQHRITVIDKPQEDVILHAKWLSGHPIIYNLGGGINHPNNPTCYATERGLNILHPTKNGYAFSGWIDENGDPIVSIPVGATGTVSITATWTPVTYSISWVLNDGAAPGGYNVDSYVCGQGVAAQDMMQPVREGYIFLGWYKIVGNDEVAVEYIDTETYGDLILRARWYDNSPVTRTNIWELGGERNDNSGTWSREDDLGKVNVPEELLTYALQGRLGIAVSATFRVSVTTEGNSTASAAASFKINGQAYHVCSATAHGNGYNLILGPQPGPEAISSSTITKNILFSGNSTIVLGCKYDFSSDKQNWAVDAFLNYKCIELTYTFYVVQ